MTSTRTMIATLTLLCGAAAASGQCNNSIKLMGSSPETGDELAAAMQFGTSNGDSRLIVGAPKADYGAFFGAGMVKLFAKFGNQWGELATINKPANPFHDDHFGQSVGISNGRLVIGAPGHQTNRGIAYIYEYQGAWTPVGTIGSSQVAQRVGEAVAIDGDFAFIGAPGTDTTNNTDSGLVSIQRRQANGTWTQVQTVSDTDFNGFYSNRNLGAAIATKGGLAVIGAPDGKEILWPSFHGYVRVMRVQPNGTWATEAELLAPHPRRIGARAGSVVATDGTRIVIAAPEYPYQSNTDGFDASNVGTAWVMKFENGEWVSEQQLKSPKAASFGRFGAAVSIHGERVLVGEPGTKSAYAYRLAGGKWVLDRSYNDEDSAANGVFGASVALSDLNVFIGDSGDDHTSMTDAGAIYLKALPGGFSDSCDGAMPLSSNTMTGCTIDATPDSVPTCGNVNTANGKSVWMSWTPSCSGNVIMDTLGSDFDTVLSVHQGCPGEVGSTLVACDDDSFPGPDRLSMLSFNYAAGTKYLINVRGYNTAAGNFTLRVNQWQTPSNDSCSTPQTVISGNAYSFANCNATTDSNISNTCANNSATKDVWFRYTAPVNGTLNLDTFGSSYDTILSVFAGGACPAAASIACNDDANPQANSAVDVEVQAGASYMIRVAGFTASSPVGDGLLNVALTPSCQCDWNHSGALSVQDIFDFLTGYFSGNGDINQSGATTVQDIFDFLACYFAGC